MFHLLIGNAIVQELKLLLQILKTQYYNTWIIQEAKNKEYPIESLSSISTELNIGSPVSELIYLQKY